MGKSTLLNALIGTKVAIITPKPQTTRHPVRGVLHDPRGQIVFVDTPGVFLGKKDHVSTRLNDIVREQMNGIDAIVYVMDPTRAPGAEEEKIQTLLRAQAVPIIAVINKSDLAGAAKPFEKQCREADVGQRVTLDISAQKNKNMTALVDALFAVLPEGEAYYPDQQMTDVSHEQWIGEIIREKLFLQLEQELPYSVRVEVTSVEKRKNDMEYVAATIWTTDDRYKGMIIGAKGARLKSVGSAARKEIELAMNQKVFLDIIVDVDAKWQERFQ